MADPKKPKPGEASERQFEDWGTAVAIGHLSQYTIWKLEDTQLILLLTGDNYEISLGIDYASLKFGILEEKKNEEKALDDL